MDTSCNQTGLYGSKQVVLIWVLPAFTILAIVAIIIRNIFIKKHCPSKDTTINLQLTDPSCSSSSSCPPTWDVFLSFYGKDTRSNFTSHLYSALDQAGFLTFRDDHALEKGQEISSSLLDAIRSSRMFIVVLSENYARSPWCLNELAEILSCNGTKNRIVPVFYYVDPSDVRHQKGDFGKALVGHKKRYSVDKIEKWKLALSEIAKLSGYHLRKEANENESDTIQEIVGNVATRESTTASHLEEYLPGIDSAVEEIYQNLRMESDDVRAIGICGMGGIGKTTIAKAFYNRNFNKFDISCFTENVKQHSQISSSQLPLLQQLLIGLLRKKDYKVTNVEISVRKLKQILHSKKSLIVLDDLDQSNYSELLARLGNFFSAGSRIIITTRDGNLLNKLKVHISEVDIYMVKALGDIDSLKLFSYHAFRKPVPPENFRKLCLRFVTYAGGLPLALKVLGSSLLGRSCEFWKAKLEKVQEISDNDILKILKLSYDELEDETEKPIFLDIAFFFVGKDKDEAVHIFKSCDFFPDVGIPILVERCLLTIDRDNKFQMHNLIQDMGRNLGKNTRLFLRGNAWKDSQNLEGGNKIEGLVLDLSTSTNGQMTTVLFERMPNLRLLEIIDAHDIKGNFKNLFPKLRCIRWHSCSWTHMPSTFRPQNLISIDMPLSKFKILWKGSMPIKQLNNLGWLNLRKCRDLKRLPEQLGDMKALKKIDASFTAIERLPDSITHLKELVELYLLGCQKLRELPEQMGEMKGLKKLNVAHSAIGQLPDSITQLKELFMLELFNCKKLRKLPEEIGNMEGLRIFDAYGSAIEQLPDSFVWLTYLAHLNLRYCKNLRNLPNGIWKLKLLKLLNISFCSKLARLPEQLERMQYLEHLSASETAIEDVPDSIGLLSRLKVLRLKCKKLKCVPESIWNLTSIESLDLHPGDIGRVSLPDSVKNMKKLKTMELSCNVRLCLPMILHLSSLQSLTLTDEGQILSLAKPSSLFELFNLRYLTLDNCTSLGSSLPELPSSLYGLNVYNYTSLAQLPNLSSLKHLMRLYIQKCISLQSIGLLPSHLRSLSVHECTSLRYLPDLSMLKDLDTLSFTKCSNLNFICLKQSSLQARLRNIPFRAYLPNGEVAEWFNYKSCGRTVSFDIPPSFGSNLLGLALWVVYTCKAADVKDTYIRAVITNDTECITENDEISVIGGAQSTVKCIIGDKISMKGGDRIKVSIGSLMYSTDRVDQEVLIGEVKVKMLGVHVIQNRFSLLTLPVRTT